MGSVTRGDDSDVDVLNDRRPDARPGPVASLPMRDELARLFGRRVDLVTRAGLNRNIRDAVLGEARTVHAE